MEGEDGKEEMEGEKERDGRKETRGRGSDVWCIGPCFLCVINNVAAVSLMPPFLAIGSSAAVD